MKDYSELKMLAEAATPGRWTAYDTHGKRFIEAIGTEDHVVCATPKKQWLKDSKYIASADPVTVLELIAEIESMKKDAARYRWLRDNDFDIGSFHPAHEHNHQSWFEYFDDESIDYNLSMQSK